MAKFKATKSQNRQLKTARQRLTREASRLEKLASEAASEQYKQDLLNRRQSLLEQKEALKVRNASNAKELDDIINASSETSKVLRGYEKQQTKIIRADQRQYSGNSTFYSSTKDIWKGLDPSQRDEAIKAYYNVNTIEEAMQAFEDATGIDLGMQEKKGAEISSDSPEVLRIRKEIAKEMLSR